MGRLQCLLEDLLFALWFGSLWAVGLIVAPLLFQNLPSALAATVAGKLFRYIHLIGIVSSGALIAVLWQRCWQENKRRLLYVLFALLLLMLLNLCWVMPQVTLLRGTAEHGQFVVWHSISSVIYLLECVAAVWVLWLRRAALHL